MRGGIAAVVTCHNLGHTLREALDSVDRQTRPADEVIVVDDASTEAQTQQLVARLEREGTRVMHAGGRGVCAARNLGARATSSEYLMWLDADDVLEPGYFEAAAGRLDADADVDFVSCALRAFGASSYVWSPSSPTFVEAVATGGVPHASTLLRRQVWERIGGFDESLPSFELLDFWATAIEQGFKGVILEQPLLNYRIREGSGYRRSIQQDIYLSRLGHFYAKHRAAVEEHGLDLIRAKEAFFISQRRYWQTMEARAASLEKELAGLDQQIADLKACTTPVTRANVVQAFRPAAGASAPAFGAILAYHRIADLRPDSHGLCTPPEVFCEHMRCLKQYFTPLPLEDLVAATASGRIPERAVAVTLDDGYLDALTTASPILSELGIPATFFINTERLDEEHERWWDMLERLFSGQELDDLNRAAWPLDAAGRRALIAGALASRGAEAAPRQTHRVLTASELRELASRPGHTMGGHTTHHLALTTQPAATRREEVFENKAALERLLDGPVHFFSYPYGDFDEATVDVVREAGYRAAVTVQPEQVSAGADWLRLPRFEITSADHLRFPAKLQEIFEGSRPCV